MIDHLHIHLHVVGQEARCPEGRCLHTRPVLLRLSVCFLSSGVGGGGCGPGAPRPPSEQAADTGHGLT